MNNSRFVPTAPELTHENSLKTLIENRTIYNLKDCEMNVFETYQQSEAVSLRFNDLVVTSMLKGKKVMRLFDEDGFDYLPGESVLVPANVEMRIDFPEASFESPTQCLALAIDNKKIEDTVAYLNDKYPREAEGELWVLDERNFFFYNNEELSNTINKLIHICKSTTLTKDILADLALQELIVRISQSQNLKAVEEEQLHKVSAPLAGVVAYIRERLNYKFSMKELSNIACLSPASLYRLFKKELSLSPIEFIMLERIKLAKKLLCDQRLYIKNVSYEVGFEDCNYFIRTFKHYEGITPRQYQQMNAKLIV